MLYQVLRQHETASKNYTQRCAWKWHASTPSKVVRSLSPGDFFFVSEKRKTIFLVVDGLHDIGLLWDKFIILRTLTTLGNLAQDHPGFMIVCGTSIASGPIDECLVSSRRRRISLPCRPLEPPTIDHKSVFKIKYIIQEILISDWGGHGRTLELLTSSLLQGDIGLRWNAWWLENC